MTYDRVAGVTFESNQEELAALLGLRRRTVGEAYRALQDRGVVRYSRGTISRSCTRRGYKMKRVSATALSKRRQAFDSRKSDGLDMREVKKGSRRRTRHCLLGKFCNLQPRSARNERGFFVRGRTAKLKPLARY